MKEVYFGCGQEFFPFIVRDRALKVSETTGESFDLQPLEDAIRSLLKLRDSISGLESARRISDFTAAQKPQLRQRAVESFFDTLFRRFAPVSPVAWKQGS